MSALTGLIALLILNAVLILAIVAIWRIGKHLDRDAERDAQLRALHAVRAIDVLRKMAVDRMSNMATTIRPNRSPKQ